MKKNDIKAAYSSVKASDDLKERIIENAENPTIKAESGKRTLSIIGIAAACTAVIALSISSIKYSGDGGAIAETGADTQLETAITELTSPSQESLFSLPETAQGTLLHSPEANTEETVGASPENLADQKITVGNRIYFKQSGDDFLFTLLLGNDTGELGDPYPGGNGLHYLKGSKNPNLLALEYDSQIVYYRYYSPVDSSGNSLENMLKTSGKSLKHISLVVENKAFAEEWTDMHTPPSIHSENGENLLDTIDFGIIEAMQDGAKFETGKDITANELVLHIVSPVSCYLYAEYADGERMAFPVSPESGVISAYTANYKMTDEFIDTFIGKKTYDTWTNSIEEYYDQQEAEFMKIADQTVNEEPSENVNELISEAYDPSSRISAPEAKEHKVSVMLKDKNGKLVNGLKVTCQAAVKFEADSSYEIDNDKGGYTPGPSLTCENKPAELTLTDGDYILTVSDMLINDIGGASKRNEMQFMISITNEADDISFEFPWDHPAPDELNSADESKAVIRLTDENDSPLFGRWVILNPKNQIYPDGYSEGWGGIVLTTNENGEAIWHCPVKGKYTISAYHVGSDDSITAFKLSDKMVIDITDENTVTIFSFKENGQLPGYTEDLIPE